jgi:c-di-GMP-binding flagellar brake protein YcgR
LILSHGARVKVEVFLKDPPLIFSSNVQKCDDKTIELAAPTVNGKKIGVPEETRVLLTEFTLEGLMVVDTHVIAVRSKPQVTWVLPVPPISNIRKIQRRIESRYEVDLHLPWIPLEGGSPGEMPLVRVVNINSHGALLTGTERYEVGDEFKLDLTSLIWVSGEMTGQKVILRAKVVRHASEDGKTVGVQFQEVERNVRTSLLSSLRRLKSRIV